MNRLTVTRLVRLVALLAIAGALSSLGIAWAAPAELFDRTPSAANGANGTLNVYGTVLFRPRYRTTSPVPQPREYLVLLDTSRSMSWNFAGQGTKNGRTVQCGPTSDPNVRRVHCGPNAPWRTTSERRIYLAKQALLRFVDRLHSNDMMRVIAFSTRKVVANDAWIRGNQAGKPALRRAVIEAGAYQGDPYRTAGEVPTASALRLANQLVALAPLTAPNGVAYGPPVVILVTSSVANSFLLSGGGWRFNDRTCIGIPFREDIAACHVGYTHDNPPMPLPITAMALEADPLKQLTFIYEIGLAGVDETGLKDVASSPSYPFFSAAPTGAELSAILADIREQTTRPCIPAGGATWRDTMPPDRVGTVPPPTGPLVYPTVGYVYLRDQSGNPLPNGPSRAPIVVDPQTGRLTYGFNNLAPGVYQMMGFVAYKGDDGVSRVYTAIFDPNTASHSRTRTFNLPPLPPGQTVTLPKLYLDLEGSVCPETQGFA